MMAGDGSARPTGRALALGGAAALAVAAIAAWHFAPASGDLADAGHLVTLAETGQTAPPALQLAIPAASRAPLPASLAGTSVDGSFTIDGAGHFVPDRNALRLFDYFFSAAGEESVEVLRGRVLLHAIGGGLPRSAVAEIAAVLDRYIAYRDAARAALASGSGGPTDIGARVTEMRALQFRLLGPELAKAFYGDDGALADIDMRRLAVERDPSMTDLERQRALAAIDAQLPPEIRDARKASTMASDLHRRAEALRAAGRSSETIEALRRTELGPAAAERLAALDRSRDLFRQRLDAYRAERRALRSKQGNVNGEAYRQALDALRERHFSGSDLMRVRALDAQPD